MALRLGDYVVAGELINRRPNSTHGWLALRGEESPIIFQLTGNCGGELRGKHLRFGVPDDRPPPKVPPLDSKKVASQQVGPTGEIVLKQVRTSVDSKATKPCLYMEWFSQNGRVVIELVDPELEWADPDEEERKAAERRAAAAGEVLDDDEIFMSDRDDGEGAAEYNAFEVPPPDADEDADDPYGLFPPGLDDELADGSDQDDAEGDGEAASPAEDASDDVAGDDATGDDATGDDAAGEAKSQKRSWDDVIPGIDPETKRMYEQWDEVTEGSQDVPFTEVFDPPIKIYTPEQMQALSDAEAEAAFKELLSRLALLGVAVAQCEHFSHRLAYRMVAEEILPRYGVHPRLPQIGWVQHYDTSEFCRKCQEEFDRKYEEESRLREQSGESTDDDAPPNTDTQPF
jgi:hypothetical protein